MAMFVDLFLVFSEKCVETFNVFKSDCRCWISCHQISFGFLYYVLFTWLRDILFLQFIIWALIKVNLFLSFCLTFWCKNVCFMIKCQFFNKYIMVWYYKIYLLSGHNWSLYKLLLCVRVLNVNNTFCANLILIFISRYNLKILYKYRCIYLKTKILKFRGYLVLQSILFYLYVLYFEQKYQNPNVFLALLSNNWHYYFSK